MLFQENMSLMADGYQGDVLGESTPDAIVSEFVRSSSNSISISLKLHCSVSHKYLLPIEHEIF